MLFSNHNMRHPIILSILACLLLTSCNTWQTYYQVCDVQSSLGVSPTGNYQYKNQDCEITYDFWCDGGNPGFIITNNTDKILYVDLTKSFFIRNGFAYDYYLGQTVSISTSHVVSTDASKSATAYGFWNSIGGLVPGSASASVTKGSASSKSETIATQQSEVLAIPPYSSKVIKEYVITHNYFYDCEYNIMPKKDEAPNYKFSLSNSPVAFSNYITYRLGTDATDRIINNEFYVSEVTYYLGTSIVKEEKRECGKDKYKIEVNQKQSPKKFYNRYEKNKNYYIE